MSNPKEIDLSKVGNPPSRRLSDKRELMVKGQRPASVKLVSAKIPSGEKLSTGSVSQDRIKYNQRQQYKPQFDEIKKFIAKEEENFKSV
jgi:hypothetical protein